MKSSPAAATVLAVVTLLVGLFSLTGSRTPYRLVYFMGYVVASEPLWRTSGAHVFWESGKYAVAAFSILALARFGLWRRSDKLSWMYFALLLPSILVLPSLDRQAISFNLSGPLALAAATALFSALPLPAKNVKQLVLAMLAPIFGLAVMATFSTLTTDSIDFYNSKVASGGMGPNQASSILGLGGLMAFLFLYLERRRLEMRLLVGGIGIWCMTQAALTFSRGGIVTTVGAIAASSYFLLRDRRSRGALVTRVALVVALAAYVILPSANAFTGGALRDRFTSTSLTGRDKIAEADLIVFRRNPLLGVGPGESPQYHSLTFRFSASHTEYSRLLAEHGSFGLLALVILAVLGVRRASANAPLPAKALAAALTTWSLLTMSHAAMRLSAVSFVFGLGGALLVLEVGVPVPAREQRFVPAGTPLASGLRHTGWSR